MIDNRKEKKVEVEVEENLADISDTVILLNFQEAISKLYPHLIPIISYCYDPWDRIVEHLYDEMVLKTFSYKYGLIFMKTKFHRYAFAIGDIRKSHHIECFVSKDKISMSHGFDIWETHASSYFENIRIVFKEFSDGINNLTGSISQDEAKNVGFQLVSVFLFNQTNKEYDEVFINAEDLTFQIVFEDLDVLSN